MLIFCFKLCFVIGFLQAFHLHSNSVRYKRDIELENITFAFDCSNRAIGFYADVEYNCQFFHMCNENGKRVPHMCANDTSFNQEYRICDWEYNFNCSDAPKWYYLNELTYATDKPEEEEEGEENYDYDYAD